MPDTLSLAIGNLCIAALFLQKHQGLYKRRYNVAVSIEYRVQY